MVTRAQLVEAARSWIGTPHVENAMRRGVGVDCKNLFVGVGKELGLPEARALMARRRNYPKGFRGRLMLEGLREALVRTADPQEGDLAAILMGRDPDPRHLAMLTRRPDSEGWWIVHTYGGGFGKVAEVPLAHWRVHSFWTWPSLQESDG